MQRNQGERRQEPRRGAEKDAAQAAGGQDRSAGEEADVQEPENVPSFLTARELQAREPGRNEPAADPAAGERHGSASFTGSRGQPIISDDQPPRGKRGLPLSQGDEMLKRKPRGKGEDDASS